MSGNRSVPLCVLSFFKGSGLVIRYVVSINWYCESEIVHTLGCCSSLPAPNFQPTATQERNDQCGNQHK